MTDSPINPTKDEKRVSPWMTVVATAVGSVIGTTAVKGMGPTVSLQIFIGSIVGGILGYLVYRFGKRRNQEKLGHIAMLGCIVAGALGGLLLGAPTALVFYFVIRSKSPA